ncbi:tRNA lysidine(34) synthetase TilS [Micromonospora endolithica]|uniref:tRNA(Ile)-lysidine synthase n=1 Tax=Micromonospora endolithica TaxID=230091 RepID=A0A3A9Z3C6_9ACTN|nr:tRNA lysidine(34) synthetase TilS [Micromonospora endolithica]RKN42735.1 tRNA lysidine(34) synthetase TilS [Micromonospora endolithica]TWJ25421.1 tRNA(Ile)-lysidine synthase [Micromonospora endolithica]
MAALAPPVAAIRVAVRRALTDLAEPGPVLVACSGGADSLALAAATAFVAPRMGRAAGLVTVDHGLQDGSAERAAAVAAWARKAGLDPVEVVRVEVAGRPGGPEAAAREARYAALTGVAVRHRAAALLIGHTRDDQAETVLLALARGAGPRGLSGMPFRRDLAGVPLLRPLLEVAREQTRDACAALGLRPWVDPHNTDPSYARARVRADVLPALVGALGPGVLDNLARTARLLAADNAVLDELAAVALAGVRHPDGGLAVPGLAELAPAVRGRVLHAWARELGAPPAALGHRHVTALEALVTTWHGQGPVSLPGGVRVCRRTDRLTVAATR